MKKNVRIRFHLKDTEGQRTGKTMIFTRFISRQDFIDTLLSRGFEEMAIGSCYTRHFQTFTDRKTKIHASQVKRADIGEYALIVSAEGEGSNEVLEELCHFILNCNVEEAEVGFTREQEKVLSQQIYAIHIGQRPNWLMQLLSQRN